MSVFKLPPLKSPNLGALISQGWRWKGLALYQTTSALDFLDKRHGPIRLTPPSQLQDHLDNYQDGIITKTELHAKLGLNQQED